MKNTHMCPWEVGQREGTRQCGALGSCVGLPWCEAVTKAATDAPASCVLSCSPCWQHLLPLVMLLTCCRTLPVAHGEGQDLISCQHLWPHLCVSGNQYSRDHRESCQKLLALVPYRPQFLFLWEKFCRNSYIEDVEDCVCEHSPSPQRLFCYVWLSDITTGHIVWGTPTVINMQPFEFKRTVRNFEQWSCSVGITSPHPL